MVLNETIIYRIKISWQIPFLPTTQKLTQTYSPTWDEKGLYMISAFFKNIIPIKHQQSKLQLINFLLELSLG